MSTEIDFDKALNMAVKTGQIEFGLNRALGNARLGRGRLYIIAENCPEEATRELEQLADKGQVCCVRVH